MAEVVPVIKPEPDVMFTHLCHLFDGDLDGYHDGLFEIAYTDSSNPKAPSKARLFGTDELEEAVEFAAATNQIPNTNLFVGPTLKKPDTLRTKRANKSNFYAMTCAYADFDDEGQAEEVANNYNGAKPTMVIITGTIPFYKVHLYWRLDEPVTDMDEAEGLLELIVKHFKSDRACTDVSRVMRLGGSIYWPWKAGRQLEVVDLEIFT